MGIYSKYIFPQILEKALSEPYIMNLRRQVLADAQGEILEIGFGTGLNLGCYPPSTSKLTVLDANPGMNRWASRRIDQSSIKVEHHVINAERLPFADNSFDTVVSTWTLCSIVDVDSALAEVKRVLKPRGQFLFIEHGLSHEPSIQRWQHLINPLNKLLADGCNVNRDIARIIQAQGLRIEKLEQFYLTTAPRIWGFFSRGKAVKPGLA